MGQNTRSVGLPLQGTQKAILDGAARSSAADVKTSFINFNVEISLQNVSNVAETSPQVYAINQNKTVLNVQTVSNNIRATSRDVKQEQTICMHHNEPLTNIPM